MRATTDLQTWEVQQLRLNKSILTSKLNHVKLI